MSMVCEGQLTPQSRHLVIANIGFHISHKQAYVVFMLDF